MSAVVEFFGLPGAGKTTVTGRMVDMGPGLCVEVQPLGLSRLNLRSTAGLNDVHVLVSYAIRRWRLTLDALRSGGGFHGLRRMAVMLRSLNHLERSPPAAQAAVMEEGAVQALWSIGGGRWSERQLERFFDAATATIRPVYVYVHVPPTVAADRILRRRKPGRFDALRADALIRELIQKAEGFERLVQAARAHDLIVIELDGREDPQAQASQVLNAVLTMAEKIGPAR